MKKLKSGCVVVLLCWCAAYGQANPIITNPGPGISAGSNGNNTLGFDFTVGSSPIQLTALGLWDENQDGFTHSHMIGLWDNSGNLLGSVIISAGTVNLLSGEFRYADLATPVTLLAGTTYVLGASYLDTDADHLVGNVAGDQATFDPAVLAGNYRFALDNGFAFPDGNSGSGSAVGPNAQFAIVPEPGRGLTALALVLGALIYIRRRIRPGAVRS
jgi:hypothetical protein